MSALNISEANEDLSRPLAEIVGYLRAREYGHLRETAQAALTSAGDRFVCDLAAHLVEEEEVLFPALRKEFPERAAELDGLVEEHGHIKVLATELARVLAEKANGPAAELGRRLLAELMDHAAREEAAVNAMTAQLDEETLKRVRDEYVARQSRLFLERSRPAWLPPAAALALEGVHNGTVRVRLSLPVGTDLSLALAGDRLLHDLRSRLPEVRKLEIVRG